MYSIQSYGCMIAYRDRTEAYAAALRQVITPESVVLDIGTGTGLFALLACQAGACRVYAIEPSPVIQLAQEMARENGYGDRIHFFQGLSTQVTLPEPVSLIVSDLRGALPLFHQHLPDIIDARSRLLSPGGILLPQRDELWGAIVTAPTLYRQVTHPWETAPYGIGMSAARQRAAHLWFKAQIQPEQLLTPPQPWATLDYPTLTHPNLSGEMSWQIEQPAIAHGFCLWFDAYILGDLGFSNAPPASGSVYNQAFFPWLQPLSLEPGERVAIRLKAHLLEQDYLWSWQTQVRAAEAPFRVKTQFQQSTFLGQPLSSTDLRKGADHHQPTLNQNGQIDRRILDLMSSPRSLREIADQVLTEFPQAFSDWKAAFARVAALSRRYSE